MKVLVTGGTGFVGAHTVAAAALAGHDVRLLVRRPEQVDVSLAPLGVQVRDIVVGDALDEQAVARALDGCEAVVHAAAVFSFDTRRAAEMLRTNLRTTELVLRQAVAQGLDPVVHVSSTVALIRYGGTAARLPLGDIEPAVRPVENRLGASRSNAGCRRSAGGEHLPGRCLPRRPGRAATLAPARALPTVA
jgi:nucleoside-diphosphate-sugar epimerase